MIYCSFLLLSGELYFDPEVVVQLFHACTVHVNGLATTALRLFLAQVVDVTVVHPHYLYHRYAVLPKVVIYRHKRIGLQEVHHFSNFADGAHYFCPRVFILVLFFSVTCALNIWSIPRASIKKLTSTICKQSSIIFARSLRSLSQSTVL